MSANPRHNPSKQQQEQQDTAQQTATYLTDDGKKNLIMALGMSGGFSRVYM